MKKFIDKLERYLIRFIVLGLVALVVVQGLMTKEPWRMYLSWGERMEGQSIGLPASSGNNDRPGAENEAAVQSPRAQLTLSVEKFSSLPQATVLVNGEKRTDFTDREVAVEVAAGDVLEIDSSLYNFPVEYRIKDISENMAFPDKGTVYTGNQGMVMIGKVIVK